MRDAGSDACPSRQRPTPLHDEMSASRTVRSTRSRSGRPCENGVARNDEGPRGEPRSPSWVECGATVVTPIGNELERELEKEALERGRAVDEGTARRLTVHLSVEALHQGGD